VSDQSDNVVILETAKQRTEREAQEYRDEVQVESLGILDKAATLIKEHRVTGVVVCFVFEDGSYGRIVPTLLANIAALIGSVATAQHDLILRTLVPDDE
jgi:hypothetical protein